MKKSIRSKNCKRSARHDPLSAVTIRPATGLQPYNVRKIVFGLGLGADMIKVHASPDVVSQLTKAGVAVFADQGHVVIDASGMTVFDQRHWEHPKPNVDVAFEVDPAEVRKYMARILGF